MTGRAAAAGMRSLHVAPQSLFLSTTSHLGDLQEPAGRHGSPGLLSQHLLQGVGRLQSAPLQLAG